MNMKVRSLKLLFFCGTMILTLASCGVNYKPVNEHRTISATDVRRVSVAADSANITLSQGTASEIKVSLTGEISGKSLLFYTNLTPDKTLQIEVDNGYGASHSRLLLNVEIPVADPDSVDFDVISGDVEISSSLQIKDTLNIKAVSGDVRLKNVTAEGSGEIKTVSGDISIEYGSSPWKTTAKAISGDIRLSLPSDANFTYKMETVSGKKVCVFSSNSSEDTVGSGGKHLELKTTSGNIRIEKR